MKNKIKLSVINSKGSKLPEEANPYLGKYDAEARRKYVAGNMEKVYAFLHEAGKDGTDLVCTCEDFSGSGDPYLRYMEDPQMFISLAEEIPGPATEKMGEIAKRYKMHVAANFYEKQGNRVYNMSVLIGRDGEIMGKYRKIHLPAGETWLVTPGEEFGIFDTDIGRIGFAVCYDIVFAEHCRILALNGADIILHPTAGWGFSGVGDSGTMGEALLKVRAAENSVYIAAAVNDTYNSPGRSCVMGNDGTILAEVAKNTEGIATAEFMPDYDVDRREHFDTFFSGIGSARARHAVERRPELYSAIAEKRPAIRERYGNTELLSDPEGIREAAAQWKEYIVDTMENRPPKLNYKW